MRIKSIDGDLRKSKTESSLQEAIRHGIFSLPEEEIFEWVEQADSRQGPKRRWSLSGIRVWTPDHRRVIVRSIGGWILKKHSLRSIVRSLLISPIFHTEEALVMTLFMRSVRSFVSSAKRPHLGATDKEMWNEVSSVLGNAEKSLVDDGERVREQDVAPIQWRGNSPVAWMGRFEQSFSTWGKLLRLGVHSHTRHDHLGSCAEALIEICHGMACCEVVGDEASSCRVFDQSRSVWIYDAARDAVIAMDASSLPSKMIERAKKGSSTKTILSRYAQATAIEKMAYYVDDAMDVVARMETKSWAKCWSSS